MNTALTIAGSDSSGGAGIQADIKTMTAHGIFAMSAITSMTAQNTTGVYAIQSSTPDFLGAQLKTVFEDIMPDAVKIGMISTAEQAEVIARSLKLYGAKHIVLDPVLVASSGSTLSGGTALEASEKLLFPMAEIITPNLPETEVLIRGASRLPKKIGNEGQMIAAAEWLAEKYGCSVLVKGGHLSGEAVDVLVESGGGRRVLRGERVPNPNNHGTGCTLSSAIASNLALGKGLEEAVDGAKRYVAGCLKAMLALGNGVGPVNHLWNLKINN